jgi:hypothetical protein
LNCEEIVMGFSRNNPVCRARPQVRLNVTSIRRSRVLDSWSAIQLHRHQGFRLTCQRHCLDISCKLLII